jgi:hypothetical protein
VKRKTDAAEVRVIKLADEIATLLSDYAVVRVEAARLHAEAMSDVVISTTAAINRAVIDAALRSVGYDVAASAWHRLDRKVCGRFKRLLALPAPTPKAIAAKLRAWDLARAAQPDEFEPSALFFDLDEFSASLLADVEFLAGEAVRA